MVRWWRPAVISAALVGMVALAGVALGRIFADAMLAWLVAGSAAGSVGLSLAARRLPNWVVAPISAVALGVYTILAMWLAARHAELTGPLPHAARDALANGIPRLLTAMIPIQSTPDTVVVPVVAAWLAGLAGAEVAVRAGRVLPGLLPPVALYGAVLYVIGPNGDASRWAALLFVGLAVAALAVSAADSAATLADSATTLADSAAMLADSAAMLADSAAMLAEVPAPARAAVRGRQAAGAAAGIAVLLALVAGVGPWLAGRVAATPVDPRRYVEPPQVDSLDESPLNRISGWALEPQQHLFDFDPVAAGSPAAKRMRLRLAVLPDYDGATWRVGATYRNAGRVLPAQPRIDGAELTEMRQRITIEGLTGRLLPVVPSPVEVVGARVAFDPVTGTLICPEQLTAGLRYEVTSEVQTPDINLLPTGDVPSGDAVARYLAVGAAIPDSIQRLAEKLATGNGAPFDRATAIEDFLAEHYRKVADAPSGHAYPNLDFFLFGPRERGGQMGTSEQFAASFAVLARLTGLPSRVVVGFDVPAAGGMVTGGDALAWPEVLFTGLGWVPFDPMPRSKDPRPVEEDFTPKPTKPSTLPSDEPTPTNIAVASSAPTLLAVASGGGPPAVVVAGGASGSVLLLVLTAAATVFALRRSLRRRRLTTGSADDRITGAWSEFTDALRLAGRPVPTHLAATEAAAYAATPTPPKRALLRRAVPHPAPSGRRAGADVAEPLPGLDDLVAGINAVGFAPGSGDNGQAASAGRQAVAYATALRARQSWWRRLWWNVHPGPLRWHRGSRKW